MATDCETEVVENEEIDQEVEINEVESETNGEEEKEQRSLVQQLELEHYEEIRRLNHKVMAARRTYIFAKSEASSCKKDYDSLVDELEELISRGPDSQAKLNFGDDRDDNEGSPGHAEPSTDAWRGVPIDRALCLTPSQMERLVEAGASTMGGLEDLRAGVGLRSIKGFGEATVDKIEDQIVDWLDANRDKFGEVVEEDESEGVEDEELDDDQEDDSDLEDL